MTNEIQYNFKEKKIIGRLNSCQIEWKPGVSSSQSLTLKELGICMERNDLLKTNKPILVFKDKKQKYLYCEYKAKKDSKKKQVIDKKIEIDETLLNDALLNENCRGDCSTTLKYALYCIDSNGKKYHGRVQKCKLTIYFTKPKINLINDIKTIVEKNYSIIQEKIELCVLKFTSIFPHHIDKNTDLTINLRVKNNVNTEYIRFSTEISEYYEVDNNGKTLTIKKSLTPTQIIECTLICDLKNNSNEQPNTFSVFFFWKIMDKMQVINQNPLSFNIQKIKSIILKDDIGKSIKKEFSIVSEKKDYKICRLKFESQCALENDVKISIKNSQKESNDICFSIINVQNDFFELSNNDKSLIIKDSINVKQTIECDLMYKLKKIPNEYIEQVFFYIESKNNKEVINKHPITVIVKKTTKSCLQLMNNINTPIEVKIQQNQKTQYRLCELHFKNISDNIIHNNINKLFVSVDSKNDNIYFSSSDNINTVKKYQLPSKLVPNESFKCQLVYLLKKLPDEPKNIIPVKFYLENEYAEKEFIQPGAMTLVMEKEVIPKVVLISEYKEPITQIFTNENEEMFLFELVFNISSLNYSTDLSDFFIRLRVTHASENQKKIDCICFSRNSMSKYCKVVDNGKRIFFNDFKFDTFDQEIKCNIVYCVKNRNVPNEDVSYKIDILAGNSDKEEKINKYIITMHIRPNTTKPKLSVDISVDNKPIKKLFVEKTQEEKSIKLPNIIWRPDITYHSEVIFLNMINSCTSGQTEDDIYITNIEIISKTISANNIVLKNYQNKSQESIVRELLFFYFVDDVGEQRKYLKDYKFKEKWTLYSDGSQSEPFNLLLLMDNKKIQSLKTGCFEIHLIFKISFNILNNGSQELTIPIHFNIKKEKSLYWLAFDFGTSAIATMFSDGSVSELIQLNPEYSKKELDYLESKNNYLYPSVYSITSENEIETLKGDEPFKAVKHLKTYSDLTRESDYVIPYLKSLLGFQEISFIKNDKHIISIEDLIRSVLMNLFCNKATGKDNDKHIDNLLFDKIKEKGHLFENIIFSHPNNFTLRHKYLYKNIIKKCFHEKMTVEFLSESDAVVFLYTSRWEFRKKIHDHIRYYQNKKDEKILVYDLGAGTLDLTYVEIRWEPDIDQIPQPKRIKVLAQYCLPKAGNYMDYIIAKAINEIICQNLCKNLESNNDIVCSAQEKKNSILKKDNEAKNFDKKFIKQKRYSEVNKVKEYFDPDYEINKRKPGKIIDTSEFIKLLYYKRYIEKIIKPQLHQSKTNILVKNIKEDNSFNTEYEIEHEVSLMFKNKFDALNLDDDEKQRIYTQITPKNISETISVKFFVNEITENAIDSISYISNIKKIKDNIDVVIASGRSINCPLIKSKLEEMFPNKIMQINQIEEKNPSEKSRESGKEDYQKTAVVRGLASYAGLVLNLEDNSLEINRKLINLRIGYILKMNSQWSYYPIIEPWYGQNEGLFPSSDDTENVEKEFGIEYNKFVEIAWVTTFEKKFDEDKTNDIFSYVNLITNRLKYQTIKSMKYDIPIKGKIIVTKNFDVKIFLTKNSKLSSFPLTDSVHIDRDYSVFDYRNNWPFFNSFKPVLS